MWVEGFRHLAPPAQLHPIWNSTCNTHSSVYDLLLATTATHSSTTTNDKVYVYLSSLQAATSRENWSSGLLLQPPPQLAARHAIFSTLENRPTKKSIRFKREFSNRKKTLQKNYCRLISQSNIKNGRSIDPPASERGYIGSKQEELQSESERERASVREVRRASNDRAAQDIPVCNSALENSNNSGRPFFGPQFWTPITLPFEGKKLPPQPPKKNPN